MGHESMILATMEPDGPETLMQVAPLLAMTGVAVATTGSSDIARMPHEFATRSGSKEVTVCPLASAATARLAIINLNAILEI